MRSLLEDKRSGSGLWFWWKRYGEHLTAPLILIALIFLGYQLFQDNQLKKEVSVNCGWGEEDYQCFCEKGEFYELQNKYLEKELGVNPLKNLTWYNSNDE